VSDSLAALNNARGAFIQFIGAVGLFGGLIYAAKTFFLTRRGQSADRYTKTIEQIARSEPQVIIGGIYGLEQIAREDDRYNQVAIDVLTALVRERAAKPTPAISAEVQAALTVLGRCKPSAKYIDLRATYLNGADLRNVQFERAKLSDSNLSNAVLIDANLRGADLTRCSLAKANLSGANLEQALLEDACLTDAELHGAVISSLELAKAAANTTDIVGP